MPVRRLPKPPIPRCESARSSIDWRFVVLFMAIYCALYLGYSAITDDYLRLNAYYHVIVLPSKTLIDWIAPAEHVVGRENILQSAEGQLQIVRGCDGAAIAFLLIAAIVAYRFHWKRTVLGVLGAMAIVYVLNEARIVTLYFLFTRKPAWFTPMHVYFIPTLMILIATIYFVIWAAPSARDNKAPGSS